MRRILTLGLAVVMAASMNGASASAKHKEWRDKECRYQYVDGRAGWSVWEVKLTIKCATARFGVSESTAMYVAERESHYGQFATNSWSGAAGVYQHLPRYWDGRVSAIRSSRPILEPIGSSIYNARSNVLAAIWMARHGWGPWSL